MADIKKYTGKKRQTQRTKLKVIIVTKTEVPAREMLFPEKLEKVNKMLSMTKFIVRP